MINYLAVGHVTQDITPDGPALGGTVTYSGLTAHALGQSTAVLTSAPPDMTDLLSPLDVLQKGIVPAEVATTYRNIYGPHGRTQVISGQATPLTPDHIPDGWPQPEIVHLGPIANEVDPAFIERYSDAFILVTPQGWMRRWDEEGRVTYRPWEEAADVLLRIDAAVISIEDVQYNEAEVQRFARLAPILAVTRAQHGCTIYVDGEPVDVAAPAVDEVNPTGAGDIFAAAFGVRLYETGDPLCAARFAIHLASHSIERVRLASIPNSDMIQEARSRF